MGWLTVVHPMTLWLPPCGLIMPFGTVILTVMLVHVTLPLLQPPPGLLVATRLHPPPDFHRATHRTLAKPIFPSPLVTILLTSGTGTTPRLLVVAPATMPHLAALCSGLSSPPATVIGRCMPVLLELAGLTSSNLLVRTTTVKWMVFRPSTTPLSRNVAMVMSSTPWRML